MGRPFRRLVMMVDIISLLCIAQLRLVGADAEFGKLVAWMKSHGGRVDRRFDVVDGTPEGVRGAIALSAIEEGTELLFCPWELVIGSTVMGNGEDGMCKVVEDMANEVRRGSDSQWHAYLDHIVLPRLAAAWDGSALAELQGIPPSRDADRHARWFSKICGGDLDDEASMFSLVAFISRASEVGMIPIYDLLNHHNGRRNAKLLVGEEGVQLMAVGKGGINQGEEIYLSYGLKAASQMYRDYGFVEAWPVVWNFRDSSTSDNFAFVQLSQGITAINPSAEYLKSIWSSNTSLLQYEAEARVHSESLSVHELERFAQAAHIHLEELQSTFEEDEVTLAGKESLLAEQRLVSTKFDTLETEDSISAIQYRMKFKSALASSFLFAEEILRQKNVESPEL